MSHSPQIQFLKADEIVLEGGGPSLSVNPLIPIISNILNTRLCALETWGLKLRDLQLNVSGHRQGTLSLI